MIIVWRVTEFCNLACGFCAYDRRVKRNRRVADVATLLNFGKLLGHYQNQAADRVLVSWLGGEPLRWAPLKAIAREYSVAYNLRLSVTTNGSSLHQSKEREALSKHFAEVTISVDAIGAAHDALRGQVGLYDRIKAGVLALVAEKRAEGQGPKLRINIVLLQHTIAAFEPLCYELASWGVEEITCNIAGGRDRPENFPAYRVTAEQMERFLDRLPAVRRALRERGVTLLGAEKYLDFLRTSSREEHRLINNCGPGSTFLFINEDGKMSPCSFTSGEYGVALADISTVAELKNLPALYAHKQDHSRAAACDDCLSTYVFEKFSPRPWILKARPWKRCYVA